MAFLRLQVFWILLRGRRSSWNGAHSAQKSWSGFDLRGGWDALRHDCVLLSRTNEFVHWYRGFTNDAPTLPPTIAALKSREVEFISPKFLSNGPEEFRIPVVRIKIFGSHATGGRSTPYFGLEVVTSPSSEGYTPKARLAASGNGHTDYRKVSEGIFEVF